MKHLDGIFALQKATTLTREELIEKAIDLGVQIEKERHACEKCTLPHFPEPLPFDKLRRGEPLKPLGPYWFDDQKKTLPFKQPYMMEINL